MGLKVELVRITENPKDAMAQAGSNCYDSVAHEGIVDHCYKSGHQSVLEFAEFHFKVSGLSRITSQQLTRHRLMSFAQRSQRYVVEDGFKYVTPNTIDCKLFVVDVPFLGSERVLSFDDMMDFLQACYDSMIKEEVPAEDARFVIPNAIETVIDIKMNFRELIHFMNERLCTRSQWEIRKLANLMKKLVIEKYPELAYMLVPKCETHGEYKFCSEAKKEWKQCQRNPHISDIFEKSYMYESVSK